MKVQRVSLAASTLDAMSEAERIFFVFLGHISNEISILNKLLLWSINVSEVGAPEQQAWITRSMFLARILAGKLNEANEVLKKRFSRATLGGSYESDLSPQARAALTKIRQYFGGRKNVITKVRKKFAFHYDMDTVTHGLQLLDEETFDLYLAPEAANCLYYGSEVVTNLAIVAELGVGSVEEALDTLVGDVSRVAGWFLQFASGALSAFAARHLQEHAESSLIEVEIGDLPHIDQVRIPFFVRSS